MSYLIANLPTLAEFCYFTFYLNHSLIEPPTYFWSFFSETERAEWAAIYLRAK